MSMFSNAAYTIKVIVMKSSKESVTTITQSDWNEFQNDPEIKTFTRRYPMDLKVHELRQSLCSSGFIPEETNKTTMYIADGFGEQFQKIHEGQDSELLEIIPSVYHPVLLAVINEDT